MAEAGRFDEVGEVWSGEVRSGERADGEGEGQDESKRKSPLLAFPLPGEEFLDSKPGLYPPRVNLTGVT